MTVLRLGIVEKMKRIISCIIAIFALSVLTQTLEAIEKDNPPIGMAVEFSDHAACVHIAKNKGWFKDKGLNVTSFDNYLTGMTLAAGLARGDINVAYMCLIPAINAYANGKVPLKVVAGTHKYGYGLLVDPKKVTIATDLQKPGIRIGCPREGSPLDALLHKMIDKYDLDEGEVLKKIRRMPPSKVFLGLKMGKLDAGFCSEQFPTMGEALGFNVLLAARDLWPDMQGSVLIVKEDLLSDHPELVNKLVEVTERGIQYIHQHPGEAAKIAAHELTISGGKIFPISMGKNAAGLDITPNVILRSLTTRMKFTSHIDPVEVQECIDYMAGLGYIKRFKAEAILDMRFLDNE